MDQRDDKKLEELVHWGCHRSTDPVLAEHTLVDRSANYGNMRRGCLLARYFRSVALLTLLEPMWFRETAIKQLNGVCSITA